MVAVIIKRIEPGFQSHINAGIACSWSPVVGGLTMLIFCSKCFSLHQSIVKTLDSQTEDDVRIIKNNLSQSPTLQELTWDALTIGF